MISEEALAPCELGSIVDEAYLVSRPNVGHSEETLVSFLTFSHDSISAVILVIISCEHVVYHFQLSSLCSWWSLIWMKVWSFPLSSSCGCCSLRTRCLSEFPGVIVDEGEEVECSVFVPHWSVAPGGLTAPLLCLPSTSSVLILNLRVIDWEKNMKYTLTMSHSFTSVMQIFPHVKYIRAVLIVSCRRSGCLELPVRRTAWAVVNCEQF